MTVIDARDLDTKTCERPGCTQVFTRRPTLSRRQFEKRRFCARTCSDQVALGGRASKGKAEPPTPADVFVPRITPAGIWRPNAPGWPDTPGGKA